MEDQAKYMMRPKLDDNKTELFRIYYNPSEISFDLMLWIEYVSINEAIIKGLQTFKAYSIQGLGPFIVSKN